MTRRRWAVLAAVAAAAAGLVYFVAVVTGWAPAAVEDMDRRRARWAAEQRRAVRSGGRQCSDDAPVLPLYLNHDEVDVLGLALAALRYYDERVLAAPPDERFGPELPRADQVHAAARQRAPLAASLRTALAELAAALERTA